MSSAHLLALAARAVAMPGRYDEERDAWIAKVDHPLKRGEEWCPHRDEGDSFRLALKLGLSVLVVNGQVRAARRYGAQQGLAGATERMAGHDPTPAAMLAVLRAAAEIGKAVR